jgi:hypothetical protein
MELQIKGNLRRQFAPAKVRTEQSWGYKADNSFLPKTMPTDVPASIRQAVIDKGVNL